MQHTATINKIVQYEAALLDSNITSSDFTKYVEKISTLREQLFYSIADQAKKNKTLKKLLIEDAVRFVQVEEVLLTRNIPQKQFSSFLQSINETYQNLQEFDTDKTLLNNINQRLNNVIKALRNSQNDRIADIYSLLYQISERITEKTQD